MNIPQNLRKIKDAFNIEQVNEHLAEGWSLIAITPRAGVMGPLYTLGWADAGTTNSERPRQSAANRARGIAE